MTVPVAVVGVDFRCASTRWRAAMALDAPGRSALHAELAGLGATGFAEIATCNRTEWIAVGGDAAWISELMRAAALERLAAIGAPTPRPYAFVGEAAARHLLRVAVGLESLARGESHIARQTHEAFTRARAEGTACAVLNVLETVIGRTVRRVGRTPRARATSTGMHRLVADALAREDLPDLPVLVVGMGAIGRRVADRIAERHAVIRVNRTPREGWVALDATLADPPPHAAAVLCTGAAEPVWTAAQLRPDTRIVVDIGSPPQVAPDVSEHARVLDLDALVASTMPDAEVAEHHEAIDAGIDDLKRALGVRALRDLVRTSRDQYRHLSYEALPGVLGRVDLSPADRQALLTDLRELLRDYAGRVLDAVETIALESNG